MVPQIMIDAGKDSSNLTKLKGFSGQGFLLHALRHDDINGGDDF